MPWKVRTVGYAEREGFRCGTCYEFKPFNFLTRKKLKVKEYPLTIMEGTLVGYRGLAPCEMKKKIALLKDVTKKTMESLYCCGIIQDLIPTTGLVTRIHMQN